MTGATLCRKLLEAAGIQARVRRGPATVYLAGERTVVLSPYCYDGSNRRELTLAAHEAGHAAQEHAYGWAAPALRWVFIGRLVLEWDASRRARLMMAGLRIQAQEDVLISSWRGYLAPALWQMLMIAALVWLGCWVRR